MSKIVSDLSVVTHVGLGLAMYVFQVHAVDGSESYGDSLLNPQTSLRSLLSSA